MADIEPSKIWAVTGLLVALICGMTVAQLRSSGSGIAEVASLEKSGTWTAPAEVPSTTSTDYGVYEAGYVGARSAFRAPVSPNPLALSPTHVLSYRTPASGTDAADDEVGPITDVAQDMLGPGYAMTDVAGSVGEATSGQSPVYAYAIDNDNTLSTFDLDYDGAIQASVNIVSYMTTISDDYIELASAPDANDLYVAFNDVSAEQDVNLAKMGRISGALQLLAMSGESADSTNMSPDQRVQALVVRQALAEGLAYEQQPQAVGLEIADLPAQQQADQEAVIRAKQQMDLMSRIQVEYHVITNQVDSDIEDLE